MDKQEAKKEHNTLMLARNWNEEKALRPILEAPNCDILLNLMGFEGRFEFEGREI